MIRKQRKAQWLYECRTCNYTSGITTDLFGAQENQLHHEGGPGHAITVFAQAFHPMVEAFSALLKPINDVAEQIAAPSAPPPNLPHDPSILRDRRKWAGR